MLEARVDQLVLVKFRREQDGHLNPLVNVSVSAIAEC